MLGEFDPKRTAACVIVKHANPCGVAEGPDLVSAYRKAFACDPQSPVRRHHRRQPARSMPQPPKRHHGNPHRSDHRARRDGRGASPSSPSAKNLRLLLAGGLPDPRAAGTAAKPSPAACWCRRRDNAVVDDLDAEVGDQAAADRRTSCATSNSRSASPSTSSPTPSSMPRTRHRRHRRRPDEPRRFRAHRRPQGAGSRRAPRSCRSR